VTEPNDPDPEELHLPEGTLAFIDEGPRNAPALLALHGIPGSSRDFRYLAPEVTRAVRFVRVDLPGFGRSSAWKEGVRSHEGRLRALLSLADHLGLATFGVLGHSMGGATALSLASRRGDRVNALILVASVGLRRHRALPADPATLGFVARLMSLPLLGWLITRRFRKRLESRRLPGTPDLVRRYLEAIAATRFQEQRRLVRGPLPPTFVVYSHDDALVETSISEELAEAILNARVLSFLEGGHNLQKTRAPEIGEALRQWLPGLRAKA
jgi:pimeloyl-ACP methyl ester carboxylesterase